MPKAYFADPQTHCSTMGQVAKKFLFCFLQLHVSLGLIAQSPKLESAVTVISTSMINPQSLRDSISIFYFDDFILYKVSKLEITSVIQYTDNNEVQNSSTSLQQKVNFFAQSKADNQMYKLHEDSVEKSPDDVNEFLEGIFKKWTMDSAALLAGGNAKTMDAIDPYKHVALFVFDPKTPSSLPDSILLYYDNKFLGVDHHLLNVFQFWKEYKLEKIRMIYHIDSTQNIQQNNHGTTIEFFSELCQPTNIEIEKAKRHYLFLINWMKTTLPEKARH